ncbi:hypothetical protein KAU11_12480 [Candidatus Babeliales bacterium]|nr:hypothetical protein [Candidatus Babeliales bacterium]
MKKVTLTATIGNREGTFSFNYSMDVEIDASLNNSLDSYASIEGLLNKGFGEILRDKFSTYKIKKVGDEPERDATPEEKDIWTKKAEKALQDGTYQFGGIGSRLSPEDKAMKASLKDAGYPVKKESSIAEMLEKATKALAASQEKDFEPEMIEKVEAALKASEVYKTTLKANLPKKAVSFDKVDL